MGTDSERTETRSGSARVITNVRFVVVPQTGMRVRVGAVVLQDHDPLVPDQKDRPHHIHGYLADPRWSEFQLSLSCGTLAYTTTDLHPPSRPDVAGERALFEWADGTTLILVKEDPSQPFEIADLAWDDARDLMTEKVVWYWTGADIPLLRFVDITKVRRGDATEGDR